MSALSTRLPLASPARACWTCARAGGGESVVRALCVAPGTRDRPWTVFPPALSGATQGVRTLTPSNAPLAGILTVSADVRGFVAPEPGSAAGAPPKRRLSAHRPEDWTVSTRV